MTKETVSDHGAHTARNLSNGMNMADAVAISANPVGIPIQMVSCALFPKWLASQPRRMRELVLTFGLSPAVSSRLLVVTSSGRLERVITITSDPVSMWDLSELSNKLPPLDYVLETVVPATDSAALALGWALGAYRFDRYRTTSETTSRSRGREPRLVMPSRPEHQQAIDVARVLTSVRTWINTPASDMGPSELEDIGRRLARRFHGRCRIVRGSALLRAYPMIHAVGRASARPPRLIDLTWGARGKPKVTIVGKGVCFDSGGLSIKPFEEMLEMKVDMAGAAHAYALAQLILEARLPVSLRVLVPAVENSIAGNAYRPLDILTSRSGLTVEIGSTDAEGRLILADALTEADADVPDVLIDFGTLTSFEAGAGLMAALFTRDNRAAARLAELSARLEDPLWRMPLTPLLAPRLKGKLADLTNTGSLYKGSTLRAALFLSNFVRRSPTWLHFDLPDGNDESRPGRPLGGDAFGLRACFMYLQERFPTRANSRRSSTRIPSRSAHK
jgi:leucyl aminopeptidase